MKTEIIGGVHAVKHLLKSSPEKVIELHVQENKSSTINEICELANNFDIKIIFMPKQKIETKVANSKGIIAYCKKEKQMDENTLIEKLESIENPLILILDGIQDPHNLGACIRTSDGAGVDAIIIPQRNSVQVNTTVKKVAAGAAENMPIVSVSNLKRFIEKIKKLGIWVVGLDSSAKTTIYEVDLKIPRAIVLGSESKGMKQIIRSECDEIAKLPMLGTVSSLNVSVATGITLYECLRQRS